MTTVGPPSRENVDPTDAAQGPRRVAPPSSNAGWAVASVLLFWPLAFSAFTHALRVYPLWASGDIEGARYASDRVRRLGQLSLWIVGTIVVVLAVAYAVVTIVLIAHGDFDTGRHGFEHGTRR